MRYETKLDSALSELRGELTCSPVRSVRRDRRPRVLLPLAVAAAAGLFLWPRTTSDAAWATIADRTNEALRWHQVQRDRKGKILYEGWRDGDKRAGYLGDNFPYEFRSDGRRMFVHIGPPKGAKYERLPNAVRYGTIGRAGSIGFEAKTSVETLLGSKHVTELSRKVVGDQLILRLKYPVESGVVVTADRADGRIREIESKSSVTRFEYPDAIPNEVFDPTRPRTKGLVVFDRSVIRREATRTMRRGLGTSGDVTLRLVALDAYGKVWAMWTGPRPKWKSTDLLELPGVSSKPSPVERMLSAANPSPAAIGGLPVSGLCVGPQVKIGNRLREIRITVSGQSTTFRNVPVLRLSSLYDLGLL